MNKMNKDKVEDGIRMMLEGLGIDLNDIHFRETPKRAMRAWTSELCSGLGDKSFELTTFAIDHDYEPSMVVLQHIPVKSVCAHHLLPFVGKATVAYIPNNLLCGLSKLARVVDYFSRRPQVQEKLTHDIANYLRTQLDPQGVGVIIKANHMCMQMRGVNHDGTMTTSSLKGTFIKEGPVRAEFMSLAQSQTMRKV